MMTEPRSSMRRGSGSEPASAAPTTNVVGGRVHFGQTSAPEVILVDDQDRRNSLSKPPKHGLKRSLSRTGIVMREAPFPDDTPTIRIAIHVFGISSLNLGAGTFELSFALHLTWPDSPSASAPEIRLRNAVQIHECTDSAVQKIEQADGVGAGAVVMYRMTTFKARLRTDFESPLFPFDPLALKLHVSIGARARLRPLGWRNDGAASLVDEGCAGSAWRLMQPKLLIEYHRAHAFMASRDAEPQALLTLRLHCHAKAFSWLLLGIASALGSLAVVAPLVDLLAPESSLAEEASGLASGPLDSTLEAFLQLPSPARSVSPNALMLSLLLVVAIGVVHSAIAPAGAGSFPSPSPLTFLNWHSAACVCVCLISGLTGQLALLASTFAPLFAVGAAGVTWLRCLSALKPAVAALRDWAERSACVPA